MCQSRRAGNNDLHDVLPLKITVNGYKHVRISPECGYVHVRVREMHGVVTGWIHDKPVLCIDEACIMW